MEQCLTEKHHFKHQTTISNPIFGQATHLIIYKQKYVDM